MTSLLVSLLFLGSFHAGHGPPAVVRLLDLTGDGQLDKLSVGTDNTLLVSVRTSGRMWQPIVQELPRAQVSGVLAEDLDGDGDVDLYLVSAGRNLVLRGEGLGFFVEDTALFGLEDAGTGVAAERLDLDGDGQADILLRNTGGDVIFWGAADGRYVRARDESTLGVDWTQVPGARRTSGPGIEELGTVGSPGAGRRVVSTSPSGTSSGGVPAPPGPVSFSGDFGAGLQTSGSHTGSGAFSVEHQGFMNDASGAYSSVGGGQFNTVLGTAGAVAGGANNLAINYASVGGGFTNTAFYSYSTVAGGQFNTAFASRATIGGGQGNTASGQHATVGGGNANTATVVYTTVSGGRLNTASDSFSTVGGGQGNVASGQRSTIGGGNSNTASASRTVVGGGQGNIVSGYQGTVGGGAFNAASGYTSTVAGGYFNTALGDFSFAAGRKAKATDAGSFVWGDSTPSDKFSGGVDSFNVYASGGASFFSDAVGTTGVTLAAGGGSWSSLSDRASKENVEVVDGRDVLDRLSAMPIATWNYRTQDDGVRHMGPMSQDFHAAFGLGVSDKLIDTIDPDGVALAAIQGLRSEKDEQLAEKDGQIAELRSRLAALEAQMAEVLRR